MKNFTALKNILSIGLLLTMISACTIEPIRNNSTEAIKGAPDWVNKGSTLTEGKAGRLFHGVALVSPQGDVALQKSIADDKSIVETGKVLASYLEVVSNNYMVNSDTGERGASEERVYRAIESTATRQIRESVTHQIDEAISRQFKKEVSQQFKDDIARQIKDSAQRNIRRAISNQVDFARELDEDISRQIKEAVSRQIKNTTQANLAGARIIGSWRDPQTYAIWSISELDLGYVKKTMTEVKELNVELKQYFELNAEAIFDQMIKEKENVNPFSFR